MEGRFTSFKNTIAGGIVGVAIIVYGFLSEKDVFAYLRGLLEYLEHFEVDEFLIAGASISAGLLLDLLLNKRQKERYIELQEQRLRVLRATMRTVQDIVNNFLNNLTLFRLEAEDRGALSESSLQVMDSLIQETSAKLNALGELQGTPEKPMAGGVVGIDFEREPPSGRSSRHDDCPGGCKTPSGC
jgi:hypothetical protein